MKSPLKSAFSGWKIALAISIGLLVSGWVLYRSLSAVQYIECAAGTGDFEWVDGNENGIIDWNNSNDFVANNSGNYRLQTVTDSLKQVSWTNSSYLWIVAAVFFMISRDFFYIVRIRLLTKNQLNWRAATYVILLWEFASALSPGVVGGAAVAMFILNRETIPFGKATAIVIITAFMDNLFFVLMIPLVFLFVHNSTLFPPDEAGSIALSWWFWSGFAIIFGVCLLLYLTIFWYPKLATRFLLFLFRLPFLKRWKFIAVEWGKDIERASLEFKAEKRAFWLKVFAATFASWISRYLVINAILNAFLALGFIDNIKVLGKQLILWLFMLVSPTPGGSGIAEYAFGELLSSFSSSAILLAALAILWRLISYFPYLFIGSIMLPSWIRRTQR
jgi:uncharacterized protein (TIRG00374 family)